MLLYNDVLASTGVTKSDLGVVGRSDTQLDEATEDVLPRGVNAASLFWPSETF